MSVIVSFMFNVIAYLFFYIFVHILTQLFQWPAQFEISTCNGLWRCGYQLSALLPVAGRWHLMGNHLHCSWRQLNDIHYDLTRNLRIIVRLKLLFCTAVLSVVKEKIENLPLNQCCNDGSHVFWWLDLNWVEVQNDSSHVMTIVTTRKTT